MFKVIVAGSRNFENYALLKSTMDVLLKLKIEQGEEIVIVCGEAHGADALGKRYASERGFAVLSFPADWRRFGKKAGVIRNRQMAEAANACVCFWDGESRGTANMIEEARRRGLPLRVKRF